MAKNYSKTIAINEYDAGILYTIPKPGGDLRTLLTLYISINRAPCPSYEEIKGTLERAMMAGIVSKQGPLYIVTDDWYSRIHAHDEDAWNEIDSMIQFQDEITGAALSVVQSNVEPVAPEEYERASAGLRRGLM